MRTITFNTVYGESGEQLDIYVNGQLAAVSVNVGMQNVISDLNKPRFKTNGEREIANLLMRDISEEFELTEAEYNQFLIDIEEKLREGIL